MNKIVPISARFRAEKPAGAPAKWARFVTFGRKMEITSSVGAAEAIDPALLKALANHRYALIINEESNGYRNIGAQMKQVAYAFGPIGLVMIAADVQDFGIALLLRQFGRARRQDPLSFAALKAFIAELNPAILKSLKRAHALWSTAYNWCLIDPERRTRAIDAYPALTTTMLENRECDMAIALSGSLEQAIAGVVGEPAGVVRYVGRRSPTMFGSEFKKAMDLMGRVPQDLWPQSRTEVERFVGAESASKNHFENNPPLQFIIDTLRSGEDLWNEGNEYGFASSLNDALHSLVTALLMPMIIGNREAAKESIATQLWNRRARTQANRSVRSGLVLAIAGNGGLNPLHRFSDAWHERFQVLDRKENGELPLELDIPTLGGTETIEIDGVTYRPLGTLQALKDESKVMKHCIETYGRQAIKCDTFAYACEGAAGRFTMTIRNKNGSFKLDDARGFKDASNDAWTAAAEKLVAHMSKVEAKPVGGEKMQALLAKSDGPAIWIQTPSIAQEIFAENFARWMPIMPTRLRARSMEEFLTNPTANVVRKYLLSRAKKQKAVQPSLIAA